MKFLLYIAFLFLLSSCSLGFLIGKTQNVTIVKDSVSTLQIEKKAPEIKDNKFILPRNAEPQQVVITRDGFKTQYGVCAPYRFSNEGIATVALNGLIVGVPATIGALSVGAGAMSAWFALVSGSIGAYFGYMATLFNPKFWEYDNVINFNEKMIPIPLKDSVSKEIRVNKVAVDITPENSEDYIINYQDYKKENIKKRSNIKSLNGLKIDDTFFSDELNNDLKKNGFIDTTGLVLRTNYNQNAYLDATVIGYKWLFIPNSGRPTDSRKTGFINVQLKMKWDVLDFYKKSILTDTIDSKSGEFVSYVKEANSDYSKDALKDAMQSSMYAFMNSEKFRSIMRLPKTSITDTLQSMEIINPKVSVASIEEAVKSCVTIKTKDGHGSGFFISENGYIVTNYHVITDTAKLEVIMNDGSKFPAKIVRFNKEADLALLKIEKNNIIPFKIPESEVSGIGKEIYVIGTPSAEDLSQTLTKGIISSVRKQSNGTKIIQTDASISRGNSGGPLIDKEGKLLGIVNAKLIGMGIEGISFAIPAGEIVKSLAIKLK
jgi:S1-C subfamily serine protease